MNIKLTINDKYLIITAIIANTAKKLTDKNNIVVVHPSIGVVLPKNVNTTYKPVIIATSIINIVIPLDTLYARSVNNIKESLATSLRFSFTALLFSIL